ncbi:type II toxin-antitoxin system RelE/ParE family toxin [Candidatus Saccharibacteria bacterium]|nr:type II toxin-antitoxin system RelE/ParE family toxin [Candidatus Saccharibacteria bacterium]
MRTYRVELTDNALEDLRELIDYYVEQELDYYAVKIIQKIYRRISGLSVFPLGYNRYEGDPTARYATIKHYYIFYDVSEQERKVTVLRVINQKRDLRAINLR